MDLCMSKKGSHRLVIDFKMGESVSHFQHRAVDFLYVFLSGKDC